MATHDPERRRSTESHQHQTDADVSGGWREEYAALACPTSIEPEHAVAMHRTDRPARYREKHRMGVSS